MADRVEVPLDKTQVKQAVQALQAFLKSKSTGESVLLEETQQVSLLFTLWKIPKKAQTIRIPLPHGQRPDTDEVCLFTRDEPNMTSDQTQRFYKKLLQERGVKNITEIIPYKVLRTEYKPHEAKRRLMGNFDMFLSDDRIRRLLPSHLGKHFYLRKKEPLCVFMQSKSLARDIHRVIQGTNLKVSNKGCCCNPVDSVKCFRCGRLLVPERFNVKPDELTDNIEAAVQTVQAKLCTKGPVLKVIHLKSQTSVALPIYTSNIDNLTELEDAAEQAKALKLEARTTEARKRKQKKNKATGEGEEKEEEIPQLVPVATPSKKAKLETPSKKKPLESAPKPTGKKRTKKSPNKRNRKSGKTDFKAKRKMPKVK
ncbi:Ribosomal L1 domain-containing protein 1 [Liparis tanakae]|uniref:Ribosomal L1 domain-containing protein 1 n=1 Tax=Liparis tanakae TaxID=230148 RepID=A0A4Z2F5W1_9TELE|nr:Ribosomal L1 domain-containing protein 1 [Liparis tanakae]